MNNSKLEIAFFGTPEFAVYTLEELEKEGIVPSLIITAPDKPKGRKLEITPSPVKVWAEEHFISTFQPEIFDEESIKTFTDDGNWDLFIVAAYGVILPKEIIDIPKHGTLNIHPSLLPKHRGASPLQTTILEDNAAGISIILMDEKMDHGPLLAQEEIPFDGVIPTMPDLGEKLFRRGGQMIGEILLQITGGTITKNEQDDAVATYTKKITKEDGLINLSDDPEKNYRKFKAYSTWPRTYFFTENDKRIVISDAELVNGKFIIKKVIPEGKKEVLYGSFIKN